MSESTTWRLTAVSALLYTASACFFVWASVRSGDRVAFVGSALFLAAAVVLLVPLLAARPQPPRFHDSEGG